MVSSLRCSNYVEKVANFIFGDGEVAWRIIGIQRAKITYFIVMPHSFAWRWLRYNSSMDNLPAHKMGRLWKFGLNEIHDRVKSGKADKSEENGK